MNKEEKKKERRREKKNRKRKLNSLPNFCRNALLLKILERTQSSSQNVGKQLSVEARQLKKTCSKC